MFMSFQSEESNRIPSNNKDSGPNDNVELL